LSFIKSLYLIDLNLIIINQVHFIKSLLSNRFIKLFLNLVHSYLHYITLHYFIDLKLIKFDRSISSQMSEKQFENKKLLFKLSTRSLFQTRACTRFQTRSMIKSESDRVSSNSESASLVSFSVIESDITKRDLARSIREQSVVDDILINQYVIRMFKTFFSK
jgi:hypothetical protein